MNMFFQYVIIYYDVDWQQVNFWNFLSRFVFLRYLFRNYVIQIKQFSDKNAYFAGDLIL